MSESNINSEGTLKRFKYDDLLGKVPHVVDKYYSEMDIYVYRTAVNNPPTDFDITPNRRRTEGTQGKAFEFQYTEEDLAFFTEKELKIEIGHDGVSVHQTLEKAISEAKRYVTGYAKKHTQEEVDYYKYHQRGVNVMRLHLVPSLGVISGFDKNRHANILLYEGVKIEDLWDPSFEIVTFNYDNNEDNK